MTSKFVTETKHFTTEELSCNCGCGLTGLRRGFGDKIEDAREKAGIAFRVRSGRRCHYWNTLQGGKSDSEHLYGEGMDIETNDSFTRWKVITAAIRAGIRRIGVGATFVHLGDGLSHKPFPVMWNYAFTGKVAKEAEDLERLEDRE